MIIVIGANWIKPDIKLRPKMEIQKGAASRAAIPPIRSVPRIVANSPARETPPEVPGGTTFHGLVMRRGGDGLSSPISVAKVSAVAVANAPRKAAKKMLVMGSTTSPVPVSEVL
jgi:hypothetical protein